MDCLSIVEIEFLAEAEGLVELSARMQELGIDNIAYYMVGEEEASLVLARRISQLRQYPYERA